MFWDFWKKITDCWVCGPKIPSGMMLRRSWSCFTDSPLELSFSVFMGKLFYNFWTNAIRPYLRLSFVVAGNEMRLNHRCKIGIHLIGSFPFVLGGRRK